MKRKIIISFIIYSFILSAQAQLKCVMAESKENDTVDLSNFKCDIIKKIDEDKYNVVCEDKLGSIYEGFINPKLGDFELKNVKGNGEVIKGTSKTKSMPPGLFEEPKCEYPECVEIYTYRRAGCPSEFEIMDLKVTFPYDKQEENKLWATECQSENKYTFREHNLVIYTNRKELMGLSAEDLCKRLNKELRITIEVDNCGGGFLVIYNLSLADLEIGNLRIEDIKKSKTTRSIELKKDNSGAVFADDVKDNWSYASENIPLNETLSIKCKFEDQKFTISYRKVRKQETPKE